MKGRLPYYLLRLAVGLLAHLPWWLIHVLSRALAWLMAHLVRYRRRVIRENLRNSFPERSEAEQRQIEWDFYLQFAYNFLSTPRLLRLPPEVIMRQHFRPHSTAGGRTESSLCLRLPWALGELGALQHGTALLRSDRCHYGSGLS